MSWLQPTLPRLCLVNKCPDFLRVFLTHVVLQSPSRQFNVRHRYHDCNGQCSASSNLKRFESYQLLQQMWSTSEQRFAIICHRPPTSHVAFTWTWPATPARTWRSRRNLTRNRLTASHSDAINNFPVIPLVLSSLGRVRNPRATCWRKTLQKCQIVSRFHRELWNLATK